MTMGIASVGPVEAEVRDRVAEYRDEQGLPNYNEALKALLEEAAD